MRLPRPPHITVIWGRARTSRLCPATSRSSSRARCQGVTMLHLPQELLSHICSYLVITPSPFEDREESLPDNRPVYLSGEDEINLDTMLDISAASSSLHEAVKPYLYRTITPPMSVTKSLLWTLTEQPSLARLVQNLSTEEAWRVEERPFILPHDHFLYSSIAAALEGKDLPEPLMQISNKASIKGNRMLCVPSSYLCAQI
jgi:hypothetical protein